MNIMPKMLRSGIAMLLALCLIMSYPITALASGENSAAEEAVATAEKYGPLADQVIDLMISNFFANATYNGYFVKSLTDDMWKEIIIDVIISELDSRDAMLTEYGIDPTPENKELLATTIYDIAVSYHAATNNHTENLEEGKRQASIEAMAFALTEITGQEDADAEVYYDLYLISEAEGHDAAVEKAGELFHGHSYEAVVTAPTCTENGYTTYTCACGDSYVDTYVPATGHIFENGYCTECGEQEALYIPGDINGDGDVNNKDLTRLFQYLSDWDVEVNEVALDINGDGDINNKDLTRLFQYLSDWDVEIY